MPDTIQFGHDDAKRYYDRFGSKQDMQGFYENAALDALVRHGRLNEAKSVLEVGCGTGKFAARLLSDHLSETARYVGIDISETMVGLATGRLEPWIDRAEVHLTDGGFDFARFGSSFDRVIFTYVFDLLGEDDIARALLGAHAVAGKEGLLCSAGLTRGQGPLSSLTSAAWTWIHRLKPSLVGGCRPLVLPRFLAPSVWRIAHREVVVSATVASEVIIAEVI